jgi:hypothetical protein
LRRLMASFRRSQVKPVTTAHATGVLSPRTYLAKHGLRAAVAGRRESGSALLQWQESDTGLPPEQVGLPFGRSSAAWGPLQAPPGVVHRPIGSVRPTSCRDSKDSPDSGLPTGAWTSLPAAAARRPRGAEAERWVAPW